MGRLDWRAQSRGRMGALGGDRVIHIAASSIDAAQRRREGSPCRRMAAALPGDRGSRPARGAARRHHPTPFAG